VLQLRRGFSEGGREGGLLFGEKGISYWCKSFICVAAIACGRFVDNCIRHMRASCTASQEVSFAPSYTHVRSSCFKSMSMS